MTNPAMLKMLGHELDGVLIDLKEGGVDEVCLQTLARVSAALHNFEPDLPTVFQQERIALFQAIKRGVRVGMAADTVEKREDLVLSHVTITRSDSGRVAAITLQDDEHRILETLWERP